eukprot:CAMPEP_0174263840 /NCGR_PEP_ID=MMETSP0439-20130205/20273_1 /TAXON_ID=0 /ORGANISM="Stereomyxa ramosa, Strain Chinc5" /LENGTH=85 /DNA_ID=CAMNT_0015349421 /DNA_START=238 /DNA_END=492 /DNA_ORIENTATION=+
MGSENRRIALEVKYGYAGKNSDLLGFCKNLMRNVDEKAKQLNLVLGALVTYPETLDFGGSGKNARAVKKLLRRNEPPYFKIIDKN